jgi:hypothetical protein
MFTLRNRFKKNASQQSYNLHIRAKKTSLNDLNYNLQQPVGNYNNDNKTYHINPDNNNYDSNNSSYNNMSNNSLNYNNSESVDYNFNENLNHDNPESEYIVDQENFNNNLSCDNPESEYIVDQDFNDNYESENEFTNSDHNLEDEYEPVSADDMPKTFDGTKPDLNWNQECPFGFFKNFTNMAMFIWVTKYMICKYYI